MIFGCFLQPSFRIQSYHRKRAGRTDAQKKASDPEAFWVWKNFLPVSSISRSVR